MRNHDLEQTARLYSQNFMVAHSPMQQMNPCLRDLNVPVLPTVDQQPAQNGLSDVAPEWRFHAEPPNILIDRTTIR